MKPTGAFRFVIGGAALLGFIAAPIATPTVAHASVSVCHSNRYSYSIGYTTGYEAAVRGTYTVDLMWCPSAYSNFARVTASASNDPAYLVGGNLVVDAGGSSQQTGLILMGPGESRDTKIIYARYALARACFYPLGQGGTCWAQPGY